jgi:hypothetical protein
MTAMVVINLLGVYHSAAFIETGIIEDSEIIEHQKYVDKLKQENRIVESPT